MFDVNWLVFFIILGVNMRVIRVLGVMIFLQDVMVVYSKRGFVFWCAWLGRKSAMSSL